MISMMWHNVEIVGLSEIERITVLVGLHTYVNVICGIIALLVDTVVNVTQ